MIVKICNSNSISSILAYNLKKVEGEVATPLSSNYMSLKASFKQHLKYLNELTSQDSRIKNVAKHIIINPAENNLDDDTLNNIATDFMNQMGWDNQPCLVVKHEDIDKIHIHIVTTNIDFNGNKIDTNYEKKRANKVRQDLEIKYNLEPAENTKLTPKEKAKKVIDNVNAFMEESKITPGSDAIHYGEKDLVKKIRKILRYITKNYRYKNTNELNKILLQYNIKAKVVSGTKKDGENYNGIMFYTLEDTEEKKGLSGSTISQQFSYSHFEQKFENDEKYFKQEKLAIKQIKDFMSKQIIRTLNQYKQGISYDDFKDILKNSGIDVQYSINNDGRLLGVSFVNNVKGIVFKLSELDKDIQSRLKDNLTKEKTLSSSERFKLIQDISKELRDIYDKEKKKNYFFESDMIVNLDSKRELFRELLIKECHLPELVDLCINNYINFKKKEFDHIKNKEIEYFKYQVNSAIETANQLNLSEDLTGCFLAKYNIMYDGKSFYHKQNNKVHYESNVSLLNNINFKEEKTFSKSDKNMIEDFLKSGISGIKYDDIHSRPMFLDFLDNQSKSDVAKKITINFVDKLLNANKNQDILIQVNILQQNGLLIIPKTQPNGTIEYFIGRYDDIDRVGYVKLKDNYRVLLDKINYQNTYNDIRLRHYNSWGLPSNKFKVMNEISIAFRSNNIKRIEYEITKISKYNPILANRLSASIATGDINQIYNTLSDLPEDLGENKKFGHIKKH